MARVIEKFFIASMLMWAVPVAILYSFNNNLFPGNRVLAKMPKDATFCKIGRFWTNCGNINAKTTIILGPSCPESLIPA